MNRKNSPASMRSPIFVEALEPRIAPAGLINESKFTSVTLGTPLLLDASGGPNDFQGISTGFGNTGAYLLYLTAGKALVYTTDLNGNGRFDPNEITGISLGVDSQGRAPSLILFSDVHGDIVTNLRPGHGVSALTDSDSKPTNGNDGRLLLDTNIGTITLRTITGSDLDPTIAGNTVSNRLELTSFSIFGNIIAGGNFGGLSIDKSGDGALSGKFNGITTDQLYTGSTPQVGGIYTGTAANHLTFSFTQSNPNNVVNVGGAFLPFKPAVGEHGGDISNVAATTVGTIFSIGTLESGDGGFGARGGNITGVTMHGTTGGYEILAGNGGGGGTGGQGGSILSFNDLGTITSEAFLHTGDGGVGTLGAGGSGGIATFATTKIAAQVHVVMGSGGDGVTAGGNGASFTAGAFPTPESPLPVGSKVQGTWHSTGDVSNQHPLADGTYAPEVINFNDPSFFHQADGTVTAQDATNAARYGDTFGDVIYTSTGPDQVVVQFGDGAGGLIDNQGNFNGTISQTVLLKVPGVVAPVVTVGDFNGDGRPDIAVASGDPNNFSGVYIFLNQIGTAFDPINSHNFRGNPLGDTPFSAALQSALPFLPDVQVTNSGVYEGPGPVYALAAGDFNGDGVTDLAYVQKTLAFDLKTTLNTVGYLIGTRVSFVNGAEVLDPVSHRPVATGHFFANASTPGGAPLLQSAFFSGGAPATLIASSLNNTNTVDPATGIPTAAEHLFYGRQGTTAVYDLSTTALDPTTHLPTTNSLNVNTISLGQVDTNRGVGIALVNATLQTFTIQDVDGDGAADLVALIRTPANFLVTFQGSGVGNFVVGSSPNGGQNAGILSDGQTTTITASDAGSPNGVSATMGLYDGLGALVLPITGDPFIQELYLTDGTGTPNFYANGGTPTFGRTFDIPVLTKDQVVQALDTFYVNVATFSGDDANPHPATGYAVLSPDISSYVDANEFIYGATGTNADGFLFSYTFARYLTENGYLISSGNGGNSRSGAGGAAGNLGGALTTGTGGTVTGAIAITFPASPQYEGQAFLHGGSGGSGFTSGGAGGNISGISVRYATGAIVSSDVQLAAGNGGNGNIGDGGRGGSLNGLSIQTGTIFISGNGGSGAHGGVGGAIQGNQQGVYDVTSGADLISANTAIALGISVPPGIDQIAFSGVGLIAGNGGQGSVQGGAGGSITDWDSVVGFQLSYNAGSGGASPGGVGGQGGSILRSSPDVNVDTLSGPLTLRTGNGGNGLAGGAGGNLDTFISRPTNPSAIPSTLTILAGSGGGGVSGAGGVGGSITNFLSNATGLIETIDLSQLGLARVIAGDGGRSFGGAGGAGGSVTTISTQATSAPLIVAGGAGGQGLTAGGAGGSVTGVTLNSLAGQNGKLLVVAGVGGDVLAAQPRDIVLPDDPNTNDLAHAILAFGGVTGVGGDGGNISNLIQPTGVQTAVDLIAGNGGNTINAGDPTTVGSSVGRGGSVTNVNLTGTVGAISRDTTLGALVNPPIKSYSFTDPTAGTLSTISSLVDFIKAGDGSFVLNDSVGNVGIVAGASGTVRGGQPASDGINGSVQNVTASSIMSIVAGSVDRVAPVRLVSGITVTNVDGVLGADKSATAPYSANGQLDYYNEAGAIVQNLQAGYRLIDGAIFATTIQQTSGGQIIRGPRVFSPSSI